MQTGSFVLIRRNLRYFLVLWKPLGFGPLRRGRSVRRCMYALRQTQVVDGDERRSVKFNRPASFFQEPLSRLKGPPRSSAAPVGRKRVAFVRSVRDSADLQA